MENTLFWETGWKRVIDDRCRSMKCAKYRLERSFTMNMEEKRAALVEKISSLSDEQLKAMEEHLTELLQTDGRTEQRYLTFQCGGQTFGIHISNIRQILQLPEITPLPGFAPYVKGMVSLRNEMFPAIDLRLRLGKPEAEDETMMTLLIVAPDDGTSFGLIIDSVNNVEDISDEEIQPLPTQQSGSRTAYLLGIAKKETAILIMDISALLLPGELDSISIASEQHTQE